MYANNLSKLLLSMSGTKEHYHLDMSDDVVRGSIVLNKGALSWPPNPPISVAAVAKPKAAAAVKAAEPLEINNFPKQMREAVMFTSGLGGLTALGMGSPNAAFTSMSTVFGLRYGVLTLYSLVYQLVHSSNAFLAVLWATTQFGLSCLPSIRP